MGLKKCSECGIEKDESEFSWHWLNIRKHSSCNECRKKYQSEYYERTRAQQAEYKSIRQVDKREEARHFVYTYLQSHPYEACGEADPYVLTFHHVKGEEKMNLSQMVNQGYSIEVLQAEIDKCQVLCANCHMRVEK